VVQKEACNAGDDDYDDDVDGECRQGNGGADQDCG
jgi:hypothetical protein